MSYPHPACNKNYHQWKLLNIVFIALFAMLLLFLLLVFTPLGDSLAVSGKQALLLSNAITPRRDAVLSLIQDGQFQNALEVCPMEFTDHMPCEDPKIFGHLTREMNFYRERHCPAREDTLLCLIPPPAGYKIPVPWPESLNKIWYSNMPHNKIANRKGHQGWMKQEGDYFIFPGGGTMFPDGAIPYIEKLRRYIPLRGGVLRNALDMGCGVASWGGYLLNQGILTLSFAPRDSHKAQIQFALERGIPAFVAMLGTRRLPFPKFSFDMVHCSRCLIPFTDYNATYFIEVDRLLRPGGYFVISGPPVKWARKDKEWADLQSIARALCYELIVVDGNTAIWKKRLTDSCMLNRSVFGLEFCGASDDPNFAWYTKLKRCVTRASSLDAKLAIGIIPKWPERVTVAHSRVDHMKNGPNLFNADTHRWQRRVAYYKNALNVKLGTPAVRNVMDMNSFLGGFAAALITDPVWVMNIVTPHKPRTLDVIYDRGLIGVYHDWCEPFSTYPRTYDLIHVTGITSLIKDLTSDTDRCHIVDLLVEMDRILRPEGTVLIRDSPEAVDNISRMTQALRWQASTHMPEPGSRGRYKILRASKRFPTHSQLL